MLSKLFDKAWDILDQPAVVTFGSECASVVSWTVLTCLLRALLLLLRVHPFLPNALLFANPILLEKFCHVSIFGCPVGITPNLPVRIAESLLGRTASVIVIIPAHLIGSIMGVAVVKLLLGLMCVTQASAQALIPIIYEYGNREGLIGWKMFFGEILVSFIFVLVYLIMPEVLKVNKKPMWITWLFLLPLLLVRLPDQSPAFAPSTLYSLWYSSRDAVLQQYNKHSIQYEHVFGPMLGGFAAGVLSIIAFPDESAWSPP